VGGSLLAKKLSKPVAGSNAAADAQAMIAQQLFEETSPVRTSLIDASTDFLEGGGPGLSSPIFGALRSNIEDQFGVARDQIIADTPQGGALIAALAELDANRANALTQARGQATESELARAMTLATGSTGQAVSGLGQAGAIQAQIAQANADRQAGLFGALGTGLGAYLGSK